MIQLGCLRLLECPQCSRREREVSRKADIADLVPHIEEKCLKCPDTDTKMDDTFPLRPIVQMRSQISLQQSCRIQVVLPYTHPIASSACLSLVIVHTICMALTSSGFKNFRNDFVFLFFHHSLTEMRRKWVYVHCNPLPKSKLGNLASFLESINFGHI